jgi:O-antigen ligase
LVATAIGAGIAVGIAGLVQLITQSGVVVADGVERATGPYTHPNNLALYLDRIALLDLGLAVGLRREARLPMAAALLCGLGLAATLSRGAAIAYLAGAVFVVGFSKVRHGLRWIGAGSAIAVAIVAVVAGQRLLDRGAEGSKSSRELVWSAAVRMIEDHPITGVGLDQFFNQYGRRYVDPAGWPERYTSHPHNVLLDFWLGLGIAGVVVLVLMIAALLLLARRQPVIEREKAIWLGAAGALIGGATHGMLDNSFFLPDLAALTWLMVALLESVRGKAGAPDG